MKKFERFISLLLTLMMLYTGVVPAAAETISSAVQVRVLPASQYAGNAGINGMGELLTSITIKDEKGNTITDVNKDVELGKKYKFSMTFAEGDEHKQFVLNSEGKLVYTFPKGLKIQDKSNFPVFAGQNRVGVFEIKNNQLIFTPFYTENGKDFFEDSSKGTSFVDYYGNAWLNFEFEGEFDGKQGSTTIQFGNGVELNVNVKVPTTPPRAEVTKNSELSADKTKISYTINAKVLDADANTFKIMDRVQSGTAIGAMSNFTVMLKKADGTLEPVPAEHYSVVHHRNGEGDYTGFDLEFTQKPIFKDTEYEIKYDVALNLDDLKGEYKNVTVGANYVQANADDGWNDKTTPGYQFEGKKKVGKDFVSADSKTQTVKWKLTIGNGTEAVSGATATDSWTPLAQGIDAMELTDDTITIKLYKGFAETDDNLLQTIRVKKSDPNFGSYFTVTTDGNGKETGFEFKTPNHAEAKRCTVEYATKVTRNESHKNSWLTVTNDASSEGDSDGGSGALGPNQQTAKAKVLEKTATTDSDYITYTVKVMVPKERIGKPLGLSDRLRWSQNTNNQWGEQSIFNNPEDIEIVGVGLTTGKQIAFTKGTVAEGETDFKFTLTQNENLDSFRILFNVPEGERDDPERYSKWLWPPYTDDDGNEQNEDVELAITYKISWDTLVSKGTDVKNLEQFDDGKLKDIDTGFIVNYAYTDGSGAFHNLNRTKTMRKEGLVTDPANGIITYTIHINPGMNAQIDGTPLIDDFDSRYLEYVAGSFKVEYRLALWNSWTVGGDLIATIHGEPEIDAANGKMTFDFDWVSSEATKSNWTCDDTKLYHIYGDERFNGLQNDSKWYQKWIAGYQSHGYTPYFKVSYQLRVKNTSVGNLSLKNTASIEGYNTVTKWIDYSPRYVTKESAYNESERELTYTLKVNEQGKTINNGTPLTLKDEMSNATPDLSSIVVKELGSGQTLAQSEWSVTYALNAQGHSVMKITLPDSKALEVTYKAYPNSPTNGATGVNVTNKATLNGVVTTTDEDGKWVTVHTGSGAAGGEHPIVFVMKVDESSQPLSGATFKLEMLRKNSEGAWYWVEIGEKTTDGTGLLRFESTPDKTFYPDRLFRFTETQAPSGYTGISEPHYFYIKDEGIEAEQLTFAGVKENQVHEQSLWYQTAVISNKRKVGAEFEFAKVNEQNAPLAQAEFSLTEWNGSAAVGSTKTAVSGANGLVRFENLERGKNYLLTETKAAPGCLRSGEKWLVTVNAEGQITVIIHGGTAGQQPSTITLEGKDVRAFVNRGVPQLPTTGGNGTLAYSVCGVTLMTISAAMLCLARRRGAEGGRRKTERLMNANPNMDIKRKEEKNMKKTLAILLAAVMLLAMSAVAMAATPTGNITVTGIEATSGMKATAYKIIGWNLDTDTNEPLDPANVWADSNIPTWLNTNGHSSDIKKYDGTDNNTENKVFNQMYQDLGIGLSLTSSAEVAANNGTAVFTGLDIGTYLIKISGENAKFVYSAVVANVGYTYNTEDHKWKVKDSTATAKAYSIPDIDKKINENDIADGHDPDHSDTVEIGEVVTFDIYAPVPKYPNDATEKHFRIYDTMCEGLTFNEGSLEVYGVPMFGNAELLDGSTAYSMKTTAGTLFDLVFNYDQIKAYSKIHITYTATVNENAEFGTTNNKNEATLKYQNNPYIEGDYDEKKDEVRVFTFKLNIDKVDGMDESIRLAGAEFELYRGNENAPSNDKVNFVLKSDGVYRLAKAGDTNTVTKLITTTSGNIKVEGLKDGVYWLKETKAPAEYNKAAEPFKVQLIQQKIDGKGTANLECGDAATEIKHQQTVKVVNNKGTIIPSTGGMGTTVFMVAGIVIMACAVVTLMLLLKRQKNGSEG